MKSNDLESKTSSASIAPFFMNTIPVPPKKSGEDYQAGQALGEFIYLAEKTVGVEPGFFAVQINEDFRSRLHFALDNMLEAKEMSVDEHTQILKETSSLSQLIHLLNSEALHSKLSVCMSRLAKNLLSEGLGKKDTVEGEINLKLWLVKNNFDDPLIAESVAPPLKNLKNTSAIKELGFGERLYYLGRLTRRRNANQEVINECIANEVALRSGMLGQTQKLVQGRYGHGGLKILSACQWESRLEPMQDQYTGSYKKGEYENYYIGKDKSTLGSGKDTLIETDQSITDLGPNLPIFITLGIRDALGSHLQNKAKIPIQHPMTHEKAYRLYGFDYGHAYPDKNPILDSLQEDFQFTQPKKSNQKFKNFSIFSDTALSDRMKGLFYLYKMLDKQSVFIGPEREKIESIIESYKQADPLFAERYDGIQKGALPRYFDELKASIEVNITETKSEDEKKELQLYLSKIEILKKNAIASQEKILGVFKKRMLLPPVCVDILNHLELLSAETSPFSSDGKVKLQELRLTKPNKPLRWEMNIDDGIAFLKSSTLLEPGLQETLQAFFNQYAPDFQLMTEKGKCVLRIRESDLSLMAEVLKTQHLIEFKKQNKPIKKRSHSNALSDDLSRPNKLFDKIAEAKEKIQSLSMALYAQIDISSLIQKGEGEAKNIFDIPAVKNIMTEYLEGKKNASDELSLGKLPKFVRDDIALSPQLMLFKLDFWIRVAYACHKEGNYMGAAFINDGIFRSRVLIDQFELKLTKETKQMYEELLAGQNEAHSNGLSHLTDTPEDRILLPTLSSYAYRLEMAKTKASQAKNTSRSDTFKIKIATEFEARKKELLKVAADELKPETILNSLKAIRVEPSASDLPFLVNEYLKARLHPNSQALSQALANQILFAMPEIQNTIPHLSSLPVPLSEAKLLAYIANHFPQSAVLIATELLNETIESPADFKEAYTNSLIIFSLMGETHLTQEMTGEHFPNMKKIEASYTPTLIDSLEPILETFLRGMTPYLRYQQHQAKKDTGNPQNAFDANKPWGIQEAFIDSLHLEMAQCVKDLNAHAAARKAKGEDFSQYILQISSEPGETQYTKVKEAQEIQIIYNKIISEACSRLLNTEGQLKAEVIAEYQEIQTQIPTKETLLTQFIESAIALLNQADEQENQALKVNELGSRALDYEDLQKKINLYQAAKTRHEDLIAVCGSNFIRNYADRLEGGENILLTDFGADFANQYDDFQKKLDQSNALKGLLMHRCQTQWTGDPKAFKEHLEIHIEELPYLASIGNTIEKATFSDKDDRLLSSYLEKARLGLIQNPKSIFGEEMHSEAILKSVKQFHQNFTQENFIEFSEMGSAVSKITEGAHAVLEEKSGVYLHPDLGPLFVKKDSRPEKNITEWVFYKMVQLLLNLTQQQDVLERMAAIALVLPNFKERHSMDNIFVGSVAHPNIDLMWKAVYQKAHPNEPLPTKRPQGFEKRYEKEVQAYIKEFMQQDNGFSMLPIMELLGHYATHMGNIAYEQEKKNHQRLLFFDYGAAAMYDLSRSEFDEPEIRGKMKDTIAKTILGVSKHYAPHYAPGIYTPEAANRLETIQTSFQTETVQEQFHAGLKQIFRQLSEVMNDNALKQFAEYLKIPKAHEIKNEDLIDQLTLHLYRCIENRIAYIPQYIRKHGFGREEAKESPEAATEALPKAAERKSLNTNISNQNTFFQRAPSFHKKLDEIYAQLEKTPLKEKDPTILRLITMIHLFRENEKSQGHEKALPSLFDEVTAIHLQLQQKTGHPPVKRICTALYSLVQNQTSLVLQKEAIKAKRETH